MPWTQLQDPKNPVTLHKLFGSLENETRILDLFNALGPLDGEHEKIHLQKVLSITPTPLPSGNLAEGEETLSSEALLSGHITYHLQDHHYKTHIVQLFVPQIAQCEKEAFFYAARTFMQSYLKDPETTSVVTAFIFTPFSIHDDFHKQPVNHCYTESNGESRWINNTVEFTYIQLPTLTWKLDELTYKKDFWYYFFKAFDTPDFHKIAEKKAEKVWEALQVLDPAQWTEEELNAYAKAQKAIALRQQKTPPDVELARREAYRLGLERGRQEKEGDDDDKASGYYEAHRMYFEGERDIQKIVKASGLAPYEVKDLIAQEERNDKQSLWRKHFEGKKTR